MALMEEATVARGGLARDDFDANRWKNEAADAREDLANSRSVVVNAVGETPAQTTQTNTAAANQGQNNPSKTNETSPTLQPVPLSAGQTAVAKLEPTSISPAAETPKVESPTAATENPAATRRIENSDAQTVAAQNKTETPTNNTAQTNMIRDDSPLAVGSLVGYATEKSSPVYPTMARNMRMTGIVKVELVIDEDGQVTRVHNSSGPAMLQRAATEAVKKWKFKPFTRGGHATKATGFVSFNFSL